MANAPISKIVLKNTTKMSLNERFTAYRQQAQAQSVLSSVRQKLQQQASVENRRLAQQMANRPSVIAALRLKKRSLQQRLGQKRNSLTPSSPKSNVKSRLSLNPRQNSTFQDRQGGINTMSRRSRKSKNRGGRPGTSPMLRARLGSKDHRAKDFINFNYRSNNRRRGGGGNFRRLGENYSRNRRQSNVAGQFRNNRSGNRGSGRNDSNWNRGMNRKIVPRKQELDNQLDEYMAETKSHLDAQLDEYMQQGI